MHFWHRKKLLPVSAAAAAAVAAAIAAAAAAAAAEPATTAVAAAVAPAAVAAAATTCTAGVAATVVATATATSAAVASASAIGAAREYVVAVGCRGRRSGSLRSAAPRGPPLSLQEPAPSAVLAGRQHQRGAGRDRQRRRAGARTTCAP